MSDNVPRFYGVSPIHRRPDRHQPRCEHLGPPGRGLKLKLSGLAVLPFVTPLEGWTVAGVVKS
jgi:hypothetical protein